MEAMVKTKKWGNSLGVILPAEIVHTSGLKPNEDVLINVERKSRVLKELFGALPFKKSTEQLLKESRKGLESKWIK